MNNHISPRGNRGKKDKSSILADVKNLLHILNPAIQRMPKIVRIEGEPFHMKNAALDIIRHYSIAKECPEVRQHHIHEMFGAFGILLANFDLCVVQGLMTDRTKLAVAIQLERIEEGIRKWRTSTRSSDRQEQYQVNVNPFTQEGTVSTRM